MRKSILKSFLEAKVNLQHKILVVDIQPEYEKVFGFNIGQFCNFLSQQQDKGSLIKICYNGYDTLGMIKEDELKSWYYENGFEGIEDVECYDKGYAFFRYCLDSGINEDDIVLLVKFMKINNINDSRDITESQLWDKFVQEYNNRELRELLEFADDAINLPDVMDWLAKMGNNLNVCGGGMNECLKEIEIALKANNQRYKLINEWVY